MTDELAGKSINEKFDLLISKLDALTKEGKIKPFKEPWYIKFTKGKLKKNHVVVQLIKTNGKMTFAIMPVDEFTVLIKDIYHEVTPGDVLSWKKYAWVIIPEWSSKAFSPSEHYQSALKDGTLVTAQPFVIAKMKKDLIKPKSSLNFMTILIIGAVVIGGYFLGIKMGWWS